MKITIEVWNFENAAMEDIKPAELAEEIHEGINNALNKIGMRLGINSIYDINGNCVGQIESEDL